MPVAARYRLSALVTVLALGLAGCSYDQRGALTAAEAECSAAALVTEGLIDSGGEQDSALVASLVALGEVASPDVRAIAEELVSLANMEEPSATFRTEWYAVLDDLDRALLDRCNYSVRALVAEAGQSSDAADGVLSTTAADNSADPDLGSSDPLDWDEIQSRVDNSDWVESGYRGIVGTGPGIHVTVYGVESVQLALTVCVDVREALATEASTTEVAIEVHGVLEGLLAQSTSGDCILR